MRKYRKKLYTALLALMTLGLCAGCYLRMRDAIPDRVYVVEGEKDALEEICTNPLVTYEPAVAASAGGGYTVEYTVGGILPLKTVSVEPTAQQYVYAGGQTVGIYMETRGVLVIDDGELTAADGSAVRPAEHILQAGDYIRKVNGTELEDKKELIRMISESGGEELTLGIVRNGEETEVAASPVLTDDGTYKLGIWVRDNIQGIGTLTYVDEQGNFGALGHGISDIDTGKLVAISDGELYQTQIRSIIKGEAGNPGSLAGVICYGKEAECGDISSNTQCGIFGTVTEAFLTSVDQEWVEVAAKEEVRTGEAVIRTTLDGVQNDYAISILEVNPSGSGGNKEIVLQVTDPQLLEKTGGIVQGM